MAATNRDLAEMVERERFRVDLYYRLNVFPIMMPPLRDRREDIPALVMHFVGHFSRKIGKPIDHVPSATMAAFEAHDWPGNVRELQNVVERAVILSDDGSLPNPLPRGRRVAPAAAPVTLRESERVLILNALEAVGWVVAGPGGAAARLGLNRTTLINMMKRHGIERPARGGLEEDDDGKPDTRTR